MFSSFKGGICLFCFVLMLVNVIVILSFLGNAFFFFFLLALAGFQIWSDRSANPAGAPF